MTIRKNAKTADSGQALAGYGRRYKRAVDAAGRYFVAGLYFVAALYLANVAAVKAAVPSPAPSHTAPSRAAAAHAVKTALPLPKSSPPSVLSKTADSLLDFALAHKIVASVIAWLIVLPSVWAFLLLVFPAALVPCLRLSAAFEFFSFNGIKVRLFEYPLLLTPFAYRGRVLDAWVGRHVEHARTFFAERERKGGRSIWVDLPVSIDGGVATSLSSNDLRPLFEKNTCVVLIHGEGGAGKTSLACQIARWGMAPEPSRRLRSNIMLPILLDYNFLEAEPPPTTPDHVLEPLARELERVSGARKKDLPPRFVSELFAQGRILVIVDSLSERNKAVREFLTARAGSEAFGHLIVTSRSEEEEALRQAALTHLEPARLQDDLWTFMRSYLEQVDRNVVFSERDVRDLCNRLSDVVGDRDITPMLATIYGDMAVQRKKSDAKLDEPRTIVELMFSYVNRVSERAGYR